MILINQINSNNISNYINNYDSADFALRFPNPKIGIPNVGMPKLPKMPKLGMPKMPKIPKYNDSLGTALRGLKNESIVKGGLPSNRRIAGRLLPAAGRDLISNPIKTIQNLRPRLRKARVYARAYGGVRIPSTRQIGRKVFRGAKDFIRDQSINAGAFLGGTTMGGLSGGNPLAAYAGSVAGAMGTRKAINNVGMAAKALRNSGGNIRQGFKNYLDSRKARSKFDINQNTLKDAYGNALTGLTPLSGFNPLIANQVAANLTPGTLSVSGIKQSFNNMKNSVTGFNPVRGINSARERIDAGLRRRYGRR